MTDIPPDHPRYASLVARERLVEALEAGYLAPQGLTAHGRGEAFDYLLGEATPPPTAQAIRAGAAALLLADRPVLSVNGNVAALAPEAIAALQKALACRVEVNLFHRTDERVWLIIERLEAHGCTDVLGRSPDARIQGLASERAKTTAEGIYAADAVLVPLEDGDRCEALVAMGKTVVTIDLNPLSRTARRASITIVDELTRALSHLLTTIAGLDAAQAQRVLTAYDNEVTRRATLAFIATRLEGLAGAGAGEPGPAGRSRSPG